jgi:hypothetical protein
MKIKLSLFLIWGFFTLHAQENTSQSISVEKSIFGVQTGFLGVWVNNESKINSKLALRTEIGMDAGLWNNIFNDDLGLIFTPVLTLEPRFYYNLEKRDSKSKRIENNSGNFISVKTSFHPDWFVISTEDNLSVIEDLSIIPTWGIRRNLGESFNLEAGFGIGYQYTFAKNIGYANNHSDVVANLNLRIGYVF